MAGSFGSRIDELIAQVGTGNLVGRLEVDQVYAHVQHEDLSFKHPRGGEALYLTKPLLENMHEYLGWIADFTLRDEGPKAGMEYSLEHLSSQGVGVRAPLEFGNLRESGHPTIVDDGVTVYDRPPIQRRLTEHELEALHHATIRGY